MIYLYALASARGLTSPAQPGLDGAPVRVVDHVGLSAVVSERGGSALVADTDSMWAHERVVEEVMDATTVLPVRFGTQFRTEAELRQTLERSGEALVAALARLAGKVELGVRALWPAEPDPGQPRPDSGRGYMMARLEAMRRGADRRQRAAAVASALHDPLARLAHDSTRRVLVTDRLVLSGAYLVSKDRIGEFRDVVAELEAAHPELEVFCTGPWPPYSFAEPSSPARAEVGPHG